MPPPGNSMSGLGLPKPAARPGYYRVPFEDALLLRFSVYNL